ncbi:hypothetical protein [Geodermatophilus sp. URMC 62]|uniref:hypothetical protein n=1 Tax=Geodermatophilus sp. URMC 62 TaxID=3423414 RepID=UPI00406BE5F8
MHGLALLAAPHAGMALLSAACLLCAAHLWRRPGRAAWAAHVVLTTAMLLAHPPVLTAHVHSTATDLAAWAGPVAGLLAVVALLLAAVRGARALSVPRPRCRWSERPGASSLLPPQGASLP